MRQAIKFMLSCAIVILALPAMAGSGAADRKAIEQIEQRLCTAQKASNVDDIMSHYVPDESLLVFDMIKPREYRGAKALRKDWEMFLADSAQSIEVCDISELVIDVSGKLATSHYIEHAEFTDKAGHRSVANTRMTHVFRKVKGSWLIIHEHGSYPIDWKTGLGDLLSSP